MNNNQTSYTENYMVPFETAFRLIEQHAKPVSDEIISIDQGRGRVLSEDVVSPISIPPFDNSAMDGYAVNSDDLLGASKQTPINLKIVGLSAAGDQPASIENTKKTAWKIMTGAPVPAGYDSIIPIENTESKENDLQVSCFSQPLFSAHIRARGEDFNQGNIILSKHAVINSNKIMAMAAVGINQIRVKTKPIIAVFSTGKELIDDPKLELKPGQIYNSNMPYILDYLEDLPVKAYKAGTNYDDVEAYQRALQEQLDSSTDIIVSTGAVSMGDFDFIPQTIIKMGGRIIFHKIAMRPGKPLLFAQFPNGCYYFGLPGNPISATIGLRFFVSYLVSLMLNLPREKATKSLLKTQLTKKKGFTNILKARSIVDRKANLISEVLNGQESFKINPLINANGWVVLDADHDSVSAGEIVDFYPSVLDHNTL